MNRKWTDQELVQAAMEGNREAASLLVEKHKRYAYTLSYRILLHHEEAEEAAHDAFMKAFKSLDTYRSEAKFTTWFYRIVVNTALSRKRRAKVYHEDINELVHQDTLMVSDEQPLGKEERTIYLQKAIAMLDEIEGTLISLFYFKELSIDEMEEITGIDKNNIKVKLFRARKKLGNHLKALLKHETSTLL